MYCGGREIARIFNLFSKNVRFLLKNSTFSTKNRISKGVVEVTFFARITGNGRSWPLSYLYFCNIMEIGQKCLFPVILAKKVTSTTPFKIRFYIENVEFFSKNRTFLQNKLKILVISLPPQYIRLLHKL